MPTYSRTIAAVALCGLLFAASLGSARAQDADQRRLQHQIKQANLYLKMKLPDRARELLTETVDAEPGRSDPLAWLALGRAYYFERRIDDLGRAVEKAETLGLKQVVGTTKEKWVRRFLKTYRTHVGAIVVDGGRCERLQFKAQLSAPMLNATRKALLESAPGWRSGELERQRGEKFFLPVGRYRFGQTKVSVLAGELARVSADEVEAACPDLPAASLAAQGVPPPGGAMTMTGVADDPSSSWFESNWGWLLLGAVVVAGGTATAVGLATAGGPDQVSFNPNPGSIRE